MFQRIKIENKDGSSQPVYFWDYNMRTAEYHAREFLKRNGAEKYNVYELEPSQFVDKTWRLIKEITGPNINVSLEGWAA